MIHRTRMRDGEERGKAMRCDPRVAKVTSRKAISECSGGDDKTEKTTLNNLAVKGSWMRYQGKM